MPGDIPIKTLHLFPEIDDLLIDVLSSLSADDWNKPTLAKAWSIKDIASHLLDVNIRTLSASRDHYFLPPDRILDGFDSLVGFLNTLNASWVTAMKRVSPAMLIELLHMTNRLYNQHLQQLPPFGQAPFSVAWAGESESTHWFNIAREYTEKWHHQQQIRHAVRDMRPLMVPHLYQPYLDTSFRALPHHFRNIKTPDGETLRVIVKGETDWAWTLSYQQKTWSLVSQPDGVPQTILCIDGTVAWRIFSRQIDRDELLRHTTISGDPVLAEHLLQLKAVMV